MGDLTGSTSDESLTSSESAVAENAEILRNSGDVSGAISLLEQAIRGGAQHPGLHNNVGLLYSQEQRWADALEAFNRAIAGGYPSQLNRGLAQEMLGNHLEAEADYLCALETNPQDPAALVNLGTLMLQSGRVVEAKSILEHAAAIDPKAHWQLADVFEALTDSHSALQQLNLAIDAGESRAYLDRALLTADMLSFEEVSADFERAIVAGARTARSDYAVFLDQSGKPEHALSVALAGITYGDDFCFAPAAVICESLGRLKEAAEYYRLAIAAGDEDYLDDLQHVLDSLVLQNERTGET
jgi:tetratricopeptide (TPR) repeat protein